MNPNEINLNNKTFRALQNSENGEVSGETIFHYFQDGDLIWGEYMGGSIHKGFLIGHRSGNRLNFTYQHVNKDREILTGRCQSTITLSKDHRIILEEEWQWTCRDHSKGTSTLIETKQ